jgi:ABC-type transport system involved in multi-copper enzyme maturation permease subunit
LLAGLAICCAATEALGQSPGLLAQGQPLVPKPYAIWVIESLGFLGLLTVLSGVAIFVGACLVVSLARRPAVIAAYSLFLLLPLLFGALGALKGCVSSFSVIAMSGAQIKQWQIFGGLAETLLLLVTALTVTLPSYLVIAIGLFVRTLAAGRNPTTHGRMAEPSPGTAVSVKEPSQP